MLEAFDGIIEYTIRPPTLAAIVGYLLLAILIDSFARDAEDPRRRRSFPTSFWVNLFAPVIFTTGLIYGLCEFGYRAWRRKS